MNRAQTGIPLKGHLAGRGQGDTKGPPTQEPELRPLGSETMGIYVPPRENAHRPGRPNDDPRVEKNA